MRGLRLASLVFFFVGMFVALPPAAAQQSDLNAILKRYREHHAAGNYLAALIEAQKVEAAVKARFGTDHANYAVALGMLALVYQTQGKHAEAEAHYQRMLAIEEAKLGKNHPDVAVTLNNLATIYRAQGKYTRAEAHHKRALAIEEKKGSDHPDVASSLVGLANVYGDQGRYAEVEALYRRALAIQEAKLGKDHPYVAETFNNLAVVYRAQGKYAEAETLYKRALAISEAKLGGDHPHVAQILNNLANMYRARGRYPEAEAHNKRALAIREAKLGKDHPHVAETLSNLANVYDDQGKYAEAEDYFKRALAIYEAKVGKDHSDVAAMLNGLAIVYWRQGKYAEAQAHHKRALAIREARLGKGHPDVVQSLNNLALVYSRQGKYAEAEVHHERALAILEAKLGKDHPDVATILNNLAIVYRAQGKVAKGLASARKASAGIIGHAATEATGGQQRSGGKGLVEQRPDYFRRHVAILHAAARQGIEPDMTLAREGFEVAQWAVQSSAAAALAQMAARQAKGTGALAQVVRERQDLERQWHALDARLNDAVAKGDVALSAALRSELSGLNARFAAIDARLAREFPDYAALAYPKPLKGNDAQVLLGPDEALVFWLAGEKESYVFALTRNGFEWKTIPLGPEALAQKVAEFWRGLDVDAVRRGLVRTDCTEAEAAKRGLTRVACGEAVAKECEQAAQRGLVRVDCSPKPDEVRKLFDLGVAHELYAALIGPVEALVKDKKHLLVAPSGALTALPFHLLVTEKPAVAVPQVKTMRDLAAYREAPWLLKRHAVTVLPSVASLKALRVFARKDQGTKPLVGFGDPVFNPEEESRPAAGGERVATRSYSEFWQGVGADHAQLRKAVRLPETAAELQAIAKNLGAPASDIHLRVAASEATVKRLSLADYKIVYFATHGLVAGEVKGLGEPSLLLTIPKEPSEADDGLLTASEVAQLKLNADWVVLSACNTIAGDKPGAEALSGLARAFFYAGARALLVSHWAVDSNAATLLTTSTFDILKSDPKLGRAEALRRAMLAYMNDTSNPRNTYPAYWAPFVVVGEGAAR